MTTKNRLLSQEQEMPSAEMVGSEDTGGMPRRRDD